jgi:cytochrome c553
MRIPSILTSAAVATFILSSAPAIAGSEAGDGEKLFKFHGCVNCHGDSGKNPISKIVPEIGGLPSDEIVSKAKKILSGEGATEESQVMHAAFYSPTQCDAPPTDAELQSIASWLSAQ